jgi:uncharacterized protein (DUF1330 family)
MLRRSDALVAESLPSGGINRNGRNVMPGYWIVKGGAIKDQAAYDEYAKRWGPVAERFGARIINAGGRLDAREGAWGRAVIVEFPSFEQAVACYEDEEYQASLPFARKAYERELAILESA